MLTVGVDTLISVADADAYFATRLNSDAWTGADAAKRGAALSTASRAIDASGRFRCGATSEGALQFPRPGETAVPKAVAHAACEQALWLLQYGADPRLALQAQGVTSVSVDGVSESYDLSRGAGRRLCPEAEALLRSFRLAGGRLTR